MKTRAAFASVALLIVLLVLGCGDDGGPEVKAPRVTQTEPQGGAVDVGLNPTISIWFSDEMEKSSLDSIYVAGSAAYSVEYDNANKKASAFVESILEPQTVYEVVVSSYVRDTNGNNMMGDYSFSFTTGPRDCAHLVDRFEPNPEPDGAPAIEVDKTYTVLSSCGGSDPDDYYQFVLTGAAKVTVRVRSTYSDTASVRWVTSLMRSSNQIFYAVADDLPALGELSYYHTLRPGTYYLQTGTHFPSDHLAAYNLTLETSVPCSDDQYEDNDFITEATPITAGYFSDLVGCYADNDYFSIALEAGQSIAATMSGGESLIVPRRLDICGPSGTSLTGHAQNTSPVYESWTALEAGTHYVKTLWIADQVAYTLHVVITSP